MRRPAAPILAMLSAALLSAAPTARPAIAQDAARSAERTIAVTATGSVTAEPDRAILTTGVTTEAQSAREAISANAAAMTKVLAALRSAGIDPADLRTQTLALATRYGKTPFSSNGVVGYTATNAVRIVIRDLKRIGEVIDEAVKAGANQLQGLSFDVSKADALRDEARKTAMANARRRAELYAAAAGVTLGPVLAISETARGSAPRPMGGGYDRSMSAVSVPVEAGSVDLAVEVHVTYGLR
jgi:uncharacterized protein YggE